MKLDDLQDWLLEQRTAENPNLIFAIFDGFRALAEWMVTALNDSLLWLTWLGMIAASDADRAALRRLARGADRVRLVRVVRAHGALGGEHPDARADVRRGAALARRSACPIGIFAGRNDRFHRGDHPGARRDADRARLRLPDAGRDPVLGRPGGGRDLHDDLRGPAGRAHHGARHPRRHARLRRGLAARSGATSAQTLVQGAAAAGPHASCCSRSTRRSCSRSRWW